MYACVLFLWLNTDLEVSRCKPILRTSAISPILANIMSPSSPNPQPNNNHIYHSNKDARLHQLQRIQMSFLCRACFHSSSVAFSQLSSRASHAALGCTQIMILHETYINSQLMQHNLILCACYFSIYNI